MGPMPLVELSEIDKVLLKQVAHESVRSAVCDGRLFTVDRESCTERLVLPGACFITLLKQGVLRGCMGTLEAHRPLLDDVISNANSAAMRDPRFPPISRGELDQLALSISVLSEPQEMVVATESELLSKIVPNVDGLILQDGAHRATYLPAVWAQLPNPQDFVRELKCKAGLSQDYWSETLKCFSYQVETIK